MCIIISPVRSSIIYGSEIMTCLADVRLKLDRAVMQIRLMCGV